MSATSRVPLGPHNLAPPSPKKIHKVNSVSELVSKFSAPQRLFQDELKTRSPPPTHLPSPPTTKQFHPPSPHKQFQPFLASPTTPTKPSLKDQHDALLDQYANKHAKLMQHQRMVERIKFEMLEISAQIEECKRNQHIQSNSAHDDLYRQVHEETSTELNRITKTDRDFDIMPAINTLTKRASNMFLNSELKHRASAIFTPQPPEFLDKTSKFFENVVTSLGKKSSPLKERSDFPDSSFDFDALRDKLDESEIELVDIDEYDSD